eukprot:scaffold529_cov308-Pinguiococcus_pyrenoidosus.AAC.57
MSVLAVLFALQTRADRHEPSLCGGYQRCEAQAAPQTQAKHDDDLQRPRHRAAAAALPTLEALNPPTWSPEALRPAELEVLSEYHLFNG